MSRKIKSDRERMAEHGDINRAIAYGCIVEDGPILMQRFGDMVRSVRRRLVFSPCSLSSEGHQGKALSVVIHVNIQTTHIHKHIPW